MRKVFFLQRDFSELTGVIHNHTNYSYDSDVTVQSVIDAAYKNRLDYLTVNDHNAIAPPDVAAKALEYFRKSKEYEPVFITGTELNDVNNNHHLLVFDGVVPDKDLSIQDNIDLQLNNNAAIFAAHPYEDRATNKFPLYKWTDMEKLNQVNGMEIWNYSSSWMSRLNPRKNGLFLVLFPNLYVKKPFAQNLKIWDEHNLNGKKLAAIGSTDAHGTKHKVFFVTIRLLTHKQLFKTIRTNVLIPEGVKIDKGSILKALKAGNSYVVNYRIGYPYNFYAGIAENTEKGVTFGEEISFTEGLKFFYRIPKDANVELFRDGTFTARQNNRTGFFDIEKAGNYRLEITRFGSGWIYTNNIYVR